MFLRPLLHHSKPRLNTLIQAFTTTAVMSTPPQIQLTPTESRFFTLLDEFAREGRKTVDPPLGEVECRIAGGWVRDKLLNIPSNDLDITLSSSSGFLFATGFVDYLSSLPPSPSSSDIPIETTRIGKVMANPDQSKHLETAATRIMGLECDFVALRSESYGDGSRIPTEVTLGTPEQDALRRDITINTLFYNVHTRLIEDWTGLGLSDLKEGLIRTPMEPRKTFLDDPLRVLRCLRFAGRLGFGLVDDLKESLRDPEIMESLRTRISRERIGIEISKMLTARTPLLALQSITSLSLYTHIFLVPPFQPSAPAYPVEDAVRAGEILEAVLPGGRWEGRVPEGLRGDVRERRKGLWLTVALCPFRGMMMKEKKREVMVAEVVVKEGLKLGNGDKDAVVKLFQASTKLSNPHLDYPPETIRSSLGMLLREPYIHDPLSDPDWRTSCLFALVMDLLEAGDEAAQERVFDRWTQWVGKVVQLGLDVAVNDKPVLDGTEINTLLSLRPSILTKSLITKVLIWQLDNPTLTKEDCKAWLLAEKAAGAIPEDVGKKGKHQELGDPVGGKKAKKA